MIQDELPFEDLLARKQMEKQALHKELIALIHPDWDSYVDNSKFRDSLQAVVELHFPQDGVCHECQDKDYHSYPCPTIKAIRKEFR